MLYDMTDIVVENFTNYTDSGVVHLLHQHERDERDEYKKKLHHHAGLECRHIVLIIRLSAKRAFIYPPDDSQRGKKKPDYKNDYRIIRVFQEQFGVDNVVPYFGNVSTEESLGIFSHACAVVGPHGAATANIVFSPPHTYVLEVSTHSIVSNIHVVPIYHPNITVNYMSNAEAGMGTGATWDLYTVGWEKVFPPVNPYVRGHQIKAHIQFKSHFILDLSDYKAMAELTCSNVKHMLSKPMGSCNNF